MTTSTSSQDAVLRRLAFWSFWLAAGAVLLALVAAVAGAVVPPDWYVQSVGRSAMMPEVSVIAWTALASSAAFCAIALAVGIVAVVRGQRGWRPVLAIFCAVALYPTVGAVYVTLKMFLYD